MLIFFVFLTTRFWIWVLLVCLDFLRLRLGKSFSMVGSNNDLTLSYFKTGHQKTGRKFGKKFLINNWS